ncbi:hypothetical protein B7C62_02665 [Kitasatospora albolonga]|uniref:Apolipoprotein N-acyltransferase n=1 Tax=Kitasatospora albolonga TaxID=68173 RepID=A0ABC8BME7_9ACTN|nr:hypothetical protein B7C62_02665 [Kitasatospora albolonga]
MQVITRESVHPWQIGLAVCAVAAPLLPVAVSGDPSFVLPLVVVTAALTAAPLFFHARPSVFRRAAGIIAAVLLPWSLIGSWWGMFVFFLSVPLLLLSVLSDPRRRPGSAKYLAGAGFLLAAAVSLFWWGRGY